MYTSIIFFQQSITYGPSIDVHPASHSSHHTRLIYTHHHHHHYVLCTASHVQYHMPTEIGMSILITFKLQIDLNIERKNSTTSIHPYNYPSMNLSVEQSMISFFITQRNGVQYVQYTISLALYTSSCMDECMDR